MTATAQPTRCRLCPATEGLRPYLAGLCCLAHTPAAMQGRPEPPDIPTPPIRGIATVQPALEEINA